MSAAPYRLSCLLCQLFGASNEPDLTSDCLLSYFQATPFVIYISVITLLLCTLMYFIEGFRRKKNAVIAAGVTDVFETRWVADNWDKVWPFSAPLLIVRPCYSVVPYA